MTATVPLRETYAVLIARAEAEMRLAEAEPLAHRARIHTAAAETWLRLAARKTKADAVPAPVGEPGLPN
jgi:hypothetical protein